ncbi:hypothetical protein Lmor_0091 [Legionella moravica]|uniref:Uncharacterized protein n=1 Tax=Legionella moravica TaxID=39962 RepID=A0A378K1W4_9GAMM|nr:hypothetical protein [Legionella moravica]KTD39440.1 hypothetical protein Lmor_0091 [Legionella moravica]STX63692.1 Uncharacterised protein [Legionella moravica]
MVKIISGKKIAWFRQMWVSSPVSGKHQMSSVLCSFNNGSVLYSVTLPESDAVRASVASWRDEQGKAVTMSQFLTVQGGADNHWRIRVPAPKVDLSLDNLLDKIDIGQQRILGFTEAPLPGICAISFDEIN